MDQHRPTRASRNLHVKLMAWHVLNEPSEDDSPTKSERRSGNQSAVVRLVPRLFQLQRSAFQSSPSKELLIIMLPFGLVVICSAVVPIVILLVLIRLTRSQITERYEVSFTDDGKTRRPLGTEEAGFLALQESRYGTVLTVFIIESEVPLNPNMVKEALIMLSKRYPLLRMRVTKDSRTGKQYFSEMDQPNFVDFQVLQDVNADEWIPVLEQQSLGWFDFASGPLWRAILLKEKYEAESKKYKNTLLFRNHHVMSDGRSFMALFEQLLEYLSLLYKDQEVVVKSLPLQPPTSYLMRHCCTPSIWEEIIVRGLAFVMRLKMIFTSRTKPANLYTAIFPPVILSNPSVDVFTSVVPRLLPAEDTLLLAKCCKKFKCTVHGAITAATHIAMARILQKADNTVKSPVAMKTSLNVGLRSECRPKIEFDEFGCFFSLVIIDSTVPGSQTDFWPFAKECTNKVHKAIADGEHHKFLKMMRLFHLFPQVQSPESAGRRDTIFNISNLGRFQLGEDRQWPYQPVGRYGVMAEHTIGPVFGNSVVTLNGRLCWGLSYFTNVTTKAQAEEFIDLAIDIIKTAIYQ